MGESTVWIGILVMAPGGTGGPDHLCLHTRRMIFPTWKGLCLGWFAQAWCHSWAQACKAKHAPPYTTSASTSPALLSKDPLHLCPARTPSAGAAALFLKRLPVVEPLGLGQVSQHSVVLPHQPMPTFTAAATCTPAQVRVGRTDGGSRPATCPDSITMGR